MGCGKLLRLILMGQRSENMVRISSNFDSGNIQVIRAEKED
ncbi:MAG: hypothetical protein ACI965_000715, partial [Paraglaciecola sp.]